MIPIIDYMLGVKKPMNYATTPTTSRARKVLLAPDLYNALADLAANEDLRMSDLVSVLINEALDSRIRRKQP